MIKEVLTEERVVGAVAAPKRTDLDSINFVVAPREYPWKLKKEVREEQNNTCQGIDDRDGYLPLCVFSIIGIGGKHIPASGGMGFEIDVSHYSHLKTDFYFTKEAVRCQCKACHALYTQELGHFSSLGKINKHDVYASNARSLNAKDKLGLDLTLRKPRMVLEALTQKLYEGGVVWEYGKDVVFTKGWNGVGTPDQINDIARRLYAPTRADKLNWDQEIKMKEHDTVYQSPDKFDAAEYYGIR